MEGVENKTDAKRTSRRPKKVKNLEKEVEFILSQDESDDDVIPSEESEVLPKTPSRIGKIKEMFTPRATEVVLHDMLQTPRRSCRKSVKPTQEYDDIVSKSCTRKNRSIKNDLMEEKEVDLENMEGPAPAPQPKWTPAKVGRVSQKRGRKSRRKTKGKQNKENKETDQVEENVEDDLKEKVDEKVEELDKETENLNKLQEQTELGEKENKDLLIETVEDEDKLKDIKKSSEKISETQEILQEVFELNETMNILNANVEKPSETSKEVLENLQDREKSSKIKENKKSADNCSETQKTLQEVEINDYNMAIFDENDEKSSKTCKNISKYSETGKTLEMLQNYSEQSSETCKNISKSSETCKTLDILQDDLEIVENMDVLYQEAIEYDKKPKNLNLELSFVNPTESLTEFMKWEEQTNNAQDMDESLHLIQEDSEDAKELQKTDFQNPEKVDKTEKENDSFGCYLKSKEIIIADLGLNPLKDEEAGDEIKKPTTEKKIDLTNDSPESEEMPSLIVCDDDEENKLNDAFDANESVMIIEENCMPCPKPQKEVLELSDFEKKANKHCNKLNDTFEANDSIFIVEDICEPVTKPSQEIMESLQLSDEEGETLKKPPRIILTTTELQNETLLSTPKLTTTEQQQQKPILKLPSIPQQSATPKLPSTTKQSVNKSLRFQPLPSTPQQQSTTNKLPSTPKQSTKAFRLPTPYRSRQKFKFDNENKPSAENNPRKPPPMINSWLSTSVTNLEPKDIVLRGIRKRSLSVCIDGNDAKRQRTLVYAEHKIKDERIVSFYSPANQTTIIADLDLIIAKSLKKQKRVANIEASLNEFVTTRRKRSLSMDESLMTTSTFASRLPRPAPSQGPPNKNQASSSKPLARTKLPNFAAIHQKNIQKMENLVDHVNRKQERAKTLINSATKIRPASAQKNILIKNKNNNEKPKAIKKIDLGVSQINKSSNMTFNSTISTAPVTNVKNDRNVNKTINLPDPYLGGITKTSNTGVIPQRIPRTGKEGQENVKKINLPHTHKTGVTPQKVTAPSQKQQIRKYLKPTQTSQNTTTTTTTRLNSTTLPTSTITKPKPNFNLSTSVVKPSGSTSTSMENLNKISNEDKMAKRLQRHMDLFKGRVPATRAGVASRKNDAVIRGVRSNRRFELQMQHRKNMEN